jgi:hypothetical protein
MAGKRVKCKQCGNVFQIPMSVGQDAAADENEPQDDYSALTALAELERSRGGEAYQPPANVSRGGTILGGQGIRGGEGLVKSSMPRTGEHEQEIPLSTPEDVGRRNVRFNFPFAKEVDQYLPWALIVGGLAITALASLKMDPLLEDPKAPGAGWIPWVRSLVAVIFYFALAGPLALRGVRMAARKIRMQMPRSATLRGLSSFMPALALGMLMFLAGGGETFGLVMGIVLGLVLAFGCVHLLFRFRFNEMPIAAAYSGGMFALGAMVAVGVVIGLNVLLTNVMVATKKADQLAGSPFAAGLSWPKIEQPVVHAKPKPPVIARTTPAATTTSADATPVAATQSSLTETLANKPTEPTPPPTPTESTTAAPQKVAVVTDTPATPNADLPQLKPSPLVLGVQQTPVGSGFLEAIFPAVPGPWTAITRGSPDRIECWNSPADQEWVQQGAIARMRDVGISNKYVIAPDGMHCARTAAFPYPCIVTYTFGDRSAADVTRLDQWSDVGLSDEVLGFVSADRILVRRTKSNDGTQVVELWDLKHKVMLKRFDINQHETDSATEAISPDGQTLALAARDEKSRTHDASILLYDVSSPEVDVMHGSPTTRRTPREQNALRTRIPISDYKIPGPFKPTGFAFSPDSKEVAVLIEQQGIGLLVVHSTSGGRAILSKSYPPLPSQAPSGFSGSSIIWLDDNSILLYGQSVLNATSGDIIGDTGFPDPHQQHFSAPDTIDLVFADPQGRHHIAVVKVAMSKLKG